MCYYGGMKSSLSQLTAGVCIVAVGALLLLDTLHITDGALGTWWPLLLIVIGVVTLANDIRNYLWGLALIAGGVLFQLRALDILSVNPWEFFWPVVIILAGFSVIANRSSRPKISKSESEDASAIFGAVDQVNTSADYKGGSVTAVFGAVKIDLRKAVIKKEATLQVFAFCGGVELIVPENVVVKSQANSILGGIDSKQSAVATKDAPVLYITGPLVMGGVEIKA